MNNNCEELSEQFNILFNQEAVGICYATLKGSFTNVNKKFADILGYTQEELINKKFFEITHPDDMEKDLVNVKRLMAGELSYFYMRKRYLKKDNSIVNVHLYVYLVKSEKGFPKHFIGFIFPIN
jgi:PAS domain S-box-containing protein